MDDIVQARRAKTRGHQKDDETAEAGGRYSAGKHIILFYYYLCFTVMECFSKCKKIFRFFVMRKRTFTNNTG